MDTWLGSGAKLLDAAAAAAAAAQAFTEAPTEDAPVISADGTKELRFGQGHLGFSLEYMHVVSVIKESQAARRGLGIGDRLIKVDGKAVPEFEADDAEGEQHAHDRVAKWLDEMPRPAFLTFVSAEVPDSTVGAPLPEDVDGPSACRRSPSPDISDGKSSDVDWEADINRSAGLLQEQQDALAKDEMALSADDSSPELKRQLELNSKLTDDLREQHRKASGLWKQLAVLKAENKQVLLLQSRAQDENSDALEAAQKREEALKGELEQLREANAADTRAAAQNATKAASTKAEAAELRADAAEAQLEALQRELAGLNAEHEIELRLLREKQDRWEKDACERFAEQERVHKEQEAKSTQLIIEARAEANGLDPNFGADVPSEALLPSRSKGDTKEVAALYDRIDVLQKRCAAMKRKMGSSSAQASGAGMSHPVWAPRLVSIVGLRAGEYMLRLYTALSVVMLRITHFLLRKEFWRWVFYLHLVVLYTIAASWYAQKVVDPVSPIDALNAQIGSAASANAKLAER